MNAFFHSLSTLLGASTLAAALALAPIAPVGAADQAQAPVDAAAQPSTAEDLAIRRDLAEAVVVVSHMDDVLFGCIANQQLGVQDVQQEHFTPDLRAAYLKVQPDIRQFIVDTWVDYDADEAARLAALLRLARRPVHRPQAIGDQHPHEPVLRRPPQACSSRTSRRPRRSSRPATSPRRKPTPGRVLMRLIRARSVNQRNVARRCSTVRGVNADHVSDRRAKFEDTASFRARAGLRRLPMMGRRVHRPSRDISAHVAHGPGRSGAARDPVGFVGMLQPAAARPGHVAGGARCRVASRAAAAAHGRGRVPVSKSPDPRARRCRGARQVDAARLELRVAGIPAELAASRRARHRDRRSGARGGRSAVAQRCGRSSPRNARELRLFGVRSGDPTHRRCRSRARSASCLPRIGAQIWPCCTGSRSRIWAPILGKRRAAARYPRWAGAARRRSCRGLAPRSGTVLHRLAQPVAWTRRSARGMPQLPQRSGVRGNRPGPRAERRARRHPSLPGALDRHPRQHRRGMRWRSLPATAPLSSLRMRRWDRSHPRGSPPASPAPAMRRSTAIPGTSTRHDLQWRRWSANRQADRAGASHAAPVARRT